MKIATLFGVAALGLAPQDELAGDFSFRGTPPEAMASIERLSNLGEAERAVKLAQELAHDEKRSEPLRAEFHYAIGVVRSRHELAGAAEDAFLGARALAGPGDLRLDATYNAGTLRLGDAERRWNDLLAGGGQPAALPGTSPPPDPKAGEEDPLETLRADYLRAKVRLVERLKADWRDPDTRANLELIQRRLRQIDEQERRQDEQQEPDPNQDSDEQGEGGEAQDEDGEPPEGEREGEQEPQPGEPDQPDRGEPEGAAQNEPQGGELPEVDEAPAGAADDQRHMSREEVMRLLDRLGQLEQEARVLEALLQQRQRIPVEKDW